MNLKMFLISLLAGLLSTMNVWVDDVKDIRLHVNDMYMIFLMSGWMVLFGSLFYKPHIHEKRQTTAQFYLYLLFFISVIVVSLIAIRNQWFVSDAQFLTGMIPHHSMAIHMAKSIKNKTTDPRVYELANNIIHAQTSEIKLMNHLLQSLN